jgi:hypothetical protein
MNTLSPKPTEYPEDSIKIPDYQKHLLNKKCIFCGVGQMKQKTPDGKYHQLHEMMDGKYCCDGECFMNCFSPINVSNNFKFIDCNGKCESSPKIGRSWWKQFGYNSPCQCLKNKVMIINN